MKKAFFWCSVRSSIYANNGQRRCRRVSVELIGPRGVSQYASVISLPSCRD